MECLYTNSIHRVMSTFVANPAVEVSCVCHKQRSRSEDPDSAAEKKEKKEKKRKNDDDDARSGRSRRRDDDDARSRRRAGKGRQGMQ